MIIRTLRERDSTKVSRAERGAGLGTSISSAVLLLKSNHKSVFFFFFFTVTFFNRKRTNFSVSFFTIWLVKL